MGLPKNKCQVSNFARCTCAVQLEALEGSLVSNLPSCVCANNLPTYDAHDLNHKNIFQQLTIKHSAQEERGPRQQPACSECSRRAPTLPFTRSGTACEWPCIECK
eukprot:1157679-Pelagomonas_calceolata.AAC.9